MKRFFSIIALLFFLNSSNAQILLNESFDTEVFPPDGWTVETHADNWHYSLSRNAMGEEVGEGSFYQKPLFMNDSTKLISPVINTAGFDSLRFEFKETILFAYGQAPLIGVKTRKNNGPWHTVWSKPVSSSINAETISFCIQNEDIGSDHFQFCLFYKGRSYVIRSWYFDDIKLYNPLEHDIEISSISVKKHLNMEDTLAPKVIVTNLGTNTEMFNLAYQYTNKENQLLFQDTINTFVSTLNSTEINLQPLVISGTDQCYTIETQALLPQDMDPANNVKKGYSYLYPLERENVLLEIGTGVTCGFCPGASMGADDLINNGKNVAVIEYHYFDHLNDPFSNEEAFQRTRFYGIYGYPTSFFDGVLSYLGGSVNESLYEIYLPMVQQRNQIKTNIKLSFEQVKLKEDSLVVAVKVKRLSPVYSGHFRLLLAVTESHIDYQWENQDELNFVERAMYPDATGVFIDLINQTEITKNFTIPISSEWNTGHLELVSFVQDYYDKEVLDALKENLMSVFVEHKKEGTNQILLYPNPVAHTIHLIFPEQFKPLNISLLDLSGRKLYKWTTFQTNSSPKEITLKRPLHIKKGIYLLKATSLDKVTVNKVIFN